jgi:hypothetical protein
VDDGRCGGELFLVVLDGHSSAHDATVMCRALHDAVARLAAGGAGIGWCGALALPHLCRCLCLVRAADRADVVRARDTAALPTAEVHPVHALTGDLASRHPPRPFGTDDRI